MARPASHAARLALLLVGALAVLGGAPSASARQYRVARYLERDGQLVLRVSVREFIDARLQKELTKGFQKIILVEARVHRSGQEAPVAVVVRSFKVIYDLWASAFRITIDDPGGTRQLRVNTLEQAVSRIAELEISLGPLSQYPRGSLARGPLYYTDVLLQFAPLPKGFLSKIRRWLRNPQGTDSRGGSPLGSRFSLFVNPRISSALKEWRFRTQKFFRP